MTNPRRSLIEWRVRLENPLSGLFRRKQTGTSVPAGRPATMKRRANYPLFVFPAAALIFILTGSSAAWGACVCRHDLKVELQPDAHRLIVQDDIGVLEWKRGDVSLVLSTRGDIKSVLVNGKPSQYSFRSGRLTLSGVSAVGGTLRVLVSFDAVFDDPVVTEPASFDNPGFGVTGSIGDRGTFLLADSGWYPSFEGCSQDFKLQVTAPRGIYAVTAGELIGHEDRDAVSISRWKTGPIGQGLSLSASKYIVRSKKDGKVPVYTYFTSENDPLSETYLNAAASHIEFYEHLFGRYPFPKFAVVENFFPTGYGFPSYTLLGASVLRLPFIPSTSLRHEIAHSWWGNGVLVDYASGNWCEGLTTYVADYLSQEMSSAEDGRLYRRQILQDYATLAASGADFPLRLFGSRSSPATRAVGYGKAAFVFHMIRQKLGDRVFWNCLRQIYKERLFKRTSWDDFRDVFVRTGGWNAAEAAVFFDQWVARSGAPVLKLKGVQSRPAGKGTGTSGRLATGSLLQAPPLFDMDMQLALQVSPEQRIDTKIRIKDASAPFCIRSSAAPQKLIVDPDVNTFRLLYPEEIPATVNSVKGSSSLLAVLGDDVEAEGETKDGRPKTREGGRLRGPSAESAKAFGFLLAGLDHEAGPIMSEKEAESKIDENKDLLFFGLPRSEKLKQLFASAPKEVTISPPGFSVKGLSGADCLFLVFADPNRGGRITALFIPAPEASADSMLAAVRKITHYGKYSYLTFSHGVIQEKRVWEVFRSPLEFDFRKQAF